MHQHTHLSSVIVLSSCYVLAACGTGSSPDLGALDAASMLTPSHIAIPNAGDPYDGHAPSSAVGTGTGLFLGDELNQNQLASNPSNAGQGWGLRTFVTFLHGAMLPSGAQIISARLVAVQSRVQGDPYGGLGGSVHIDHLDYGELDPTDYALSALTSNLAVLSMDKAAGASGGKREADITAAVVSDVASSRGRTQLRLHFDKQSDNDSLLDLAVFSDASDTNSNAPGAMSLEIDFIAP